ncbi:hypothetical protein SAMN04487759_1455 [Kandleria vitulina]|jgi:AAA15 family ATPase/GTPase|uniref:ATPase AAA-type core domain-containing protein n=1 Tax=Kandleria vitulina TaxID=1630 RepID=A0A1H2W4K4_9FIRM|nr:ATP-binding protein [Kandleria vitulina]SDW75174.1 hypothetical protein SAMN04487759_1455 [Kandleria vitulina]
MLIQFNFKNYKSFRDETTLDLSATNITEFSERVEKVNGEKILPVAAIYGANASGKSNVYSAFAFMSKYVLNSFNYGDDRKEYDEVRPSPFLFDSKSEAEDTTFEVYFTLPKDQSEYVYNYGFCLGIEGVTEEWLNYRVANSEKSKTIFYRDKDTLDLSGISKKSRDNIKIALEQQVLVASLGAKLKINECKMVRDWFKENEFADFGNAVSNFFLSRMLPSGFVEDASVQDDVVNFFSSFDDQIKGFEVNKIPSPDNDKAERYTIDALHKKLNSEELAKIPLSSESAGTLKMFALYSELQSVLKKGSILFVDELNARLHPLLVRNIILTFYNPKVNVNNAQLIFTTHDTWQLSNQLLRRDEIWFTEKDKNGVSTLYSLVDFVDEKGTRIRKDESYEKNYLLGKYGAIPTLNNIGLLEEN